MRTYTSGRDSVTLAEARNCWLICNIPVCCLGGMKLGMTMKDIDGSATWFSGRRRRWQRLGDGRR